MPQNSCLWRILYKWQLKFASWRVFWSLSWVIILYSDFSLNWNGLRWTVLTGVIPGSQWQIFVASDLPEKNTKFFIWARKNEKHSRAGDNCFPQLNGTALSQFILTLNLVSNAAWHSGVRSNWQLNCLNWCLNWPKNSKRAETAKKHSVATDVTLFSKGLLVCISFQVYQSPYCKILTAAQQQRTPLLIHRVGLQVHVASCFNCHPAKRITVQVSPQVSAFLILIGVFLWIAVPKCQTFPADWFFLFKFFILPLPCFWPSHLNHMVWNYAFVGIVENTPPA